jgi:hypothetical protein
MTDVSTTTDSAAPEEGAALEVLDRTTGVLVDLRAADDETLADLSVRTGELRAELAQTEALISDELVARLDRDLKWTRRTGIVHGRVQYEITAPAPTAGTIGYDERAMEAELTTLVEDGVLSEAGAGEALRRHVTIVARVPFGQDVDHVAKELREAQSVTIAGAECQVVEATVTRQVMANGVKSAAKVPAAKEAIDRATIAKTPPPRRAKIKVKTKDDA